MLRSKKSERPRKWRNEESYAAEHFWPEAAERFETWGGKGGGGNRLIFHSAIRIDPSDVPKCPLILRCSLVQANLFSIFTVSSVSVIDLWQCISMQLSRRSCFIRCFSAGSWVVWGQKMRALKSPMSKVLSNTSLSGFFWEAKRGGGGGTLLLQLFAPASAAPFLADKCGETFDLFFYIYIY